MRKERQDQMCPVVLVAGCISMLRRWVFSNVKLVSLVFESPKWWGLEKDEDEVFRFQIFEERSMTVKTHWLLMIKKMYFLSLQYGSYNKYENNSWSIITKILIDYIYILQNGDNWFIVLGIQLLSLLFVIKLSIHWLFTFLIFVQW